jgi:hypothetical protein
MAAAWTPNSSPAARRRHPIPPDPIRACRHSIARRSAKADRGWFLAEGAIGAFFDTFMLLSNPNAYDVTATLTFLLENGVTVPYDVTIGANRRLTINIEEVPGMPAGSAW